MFDLFKKLFPRRPTFDRPVSAPLAETIVDRPTTIVIAAPPAPPPLPRHRVVELPQGSDVSSLL